jgi:pantoate--beta-alanine ligase
MVICKHSKDLISYLSKIRISENPVGFVPTMGALHKGHISLIKESKKGSAITVCSVFVNPTQFNNPDDFKKYPITIEQDLLMLEENGCDILFLPDENEIYPDKASREKYFDLGFLETILEGRYRPGHFQGVCLIMDKLLDIVKPDLLFLGQKDFQQCLVIKKLIEIKKVVVEVVVCPIIREPDGLAMSSRNTRLSDEERKLAPELYRTLQSIKNNLNSSNFDHLRKEAIEELEKKTFKVDYLELVSKNNLKEAHLPTQEPLVLVIAAYISDVRLIDNLIIND